jgi:hypothetical protein
MSVKPREAAEGSVFRFTGSHWRPNRRVTATFGVYCRPSEVCIEIAYIVRVRTDDTGRFVFRLRAGPEQAGDDRRRIHSGSAPTFSQTTRSGRTAARRPRYRVTTPS